MQAPRGGLYLEGRLNGGFFALRVLGGLIFGGGYVWRGLFSEFYGTVLVCLIVNKCSLLNTA